MILSGKQPLSLTLTDLFTHRLDPQRKDALARFLLNQLAGESLLPLERPRDSALAEPVHFFATSSGHVRFPEAPSFPAGWRHARPLSTRQLAALALAVGFDEISPTAWKRMIERVKKARAYLPAEGAMRGRDLRAYLQHVDADFYAEVIAKIDDGKMYLWPTNVFARKKVCASHLRQKPQQHASSVPTYDTNNQEAVPPFFETSKGAQ